MSNGYVWCVAAVYVHLLDSPEAVCRHPLWRNGIHCSRSCRARWSNVTNWWAISAVVIHRHNSNVHALLRLCDCGHNIFAGDSALFILSIHVLCKTRQFWFVSRLEWQGPAAFAFFYLVKYKSSMNATNMHRQNLSTCIRVYCKAWLRMHSHS